MSRIRTSLTLRTLEDRTVPAAAGALDPTFGIAGLVTPSSSEFSGTFTTIQTASGPNGTTFVLGRISNPLPRQVFLKYDPNGKLDPTFGTGGVSSFVVGIPPLTAFAVDARGRVVTAGNNFASIRLTEQGKLDSTYRSTVYTLNNSTPNSVVIAPDGRILLAGSIDLTDITFSFTRSMYVVRLQPDGTADGSFGVNGAVAISFPIGFENSAQASGIAVDAMGRIIVAGQATVDSFGIPFYNTISRYDAVLVRLDSSGNLDSTFGDGGRVRLNTSGLGAIADDVRVLADGRILAAGKGSNSSAFVARWNANGSLDYAYGNAGFSSVAGTEAALLADGRAVVVSGANLFRIDRDGNLDENFASQLLPTGTALSLSEAAIGPPGTILTLSQRNSEPATLFRVLGESTAYPTPAGTIAIGGSKDGAFTVIQPNASGMMDIAFPQNLYPGFTGDVRTTTADVNGDGTLDYISGPGLLGGPNVVVTDGKTGKRIADFNAFETVFTGGVFVAAADLNGDGFADVVVTPDQGGGPVVVIYDGAKLSNGSNEAAQLVRFFGIADTAFRGGARPALGDINGDGMADLVIAAGFGGGPRVAIYDGRSVLDPSTYTRELIGYEVLPVKPFTSPIYSEATPPKLMADFFVFEKELRNGVFVGVGDLNGDGKADLVAGGGPGGGPRVMALDGQELLGGREKPLLNFIAGDVESRGGIHVAVKPAPDGTPRIVTGSGERQRAQVHFYTATGSDAGTFFPYGDAVLETGVYVG